MAEDYDGNDITIGSIVTKIGNSLEFTVTDASFNIWE